MLKKILALVLASVMLLSMVACGKKTDPSATGTPSAGAEDSAAPAAEKTKIVVWMLTSSNNAKDEVAQQQEKLNAMLADKNIEVEVVGQAIANYNDLVLSASLAKEGFDVCFDYSGQSFIGKVDKGIFLQLDGLVSQESIDNAIGMEACMYEGKTYGLPYRLDAQHMFYNKRMFEEAGTTPEEFLDGFEGFMSAGEKLKAKGYAASAFANKEGFMNEWFFYMGVGSIYPDVDSFVEGHTDEQTYNDEAMIEMVSNYKKAFDAGVFFDGQTLDWGSSYMQSFLNQQSATTFGGTDWYTNIIEAGIPAEDIGVIPWPSLASGGSSKVYTAPLLYGVASFSKHPAEAAAVVEALASAEYGENAAYIVPNTQWVCPPDAENPALPLVAELVKTNSMVYPYNYTSAEAYDVVLRDLQLVLGGSMTPEELCNKVQSTHEAAIAQK